MDNEKLVCTWHESLTIVSFNTHIVNYRNSLLTKHYTQTLVTTPEMSRMPGLKTWTQKTPGYSVAIRFEKKLFTNEFCKYISDGFARFLTYKNLCVIENLIEKR